MDSQQKQQAPSKAFPKIRSFDKIQNPGNMKSTHGLL